MDLFIQIIIGIIGVIGLGLTIYSMVCIFLEEKKSYENVRVELIIYTDNLKKIDREKICYYIKKHKICEIDKYIDKISWR